MAASPLHQHDRNRRWVARGTLLVGLMLVVGLAAVLVAHNRAGAEAAVTLTQHDGTTLEAEILEVQTDRFRARVDGRERTLSFDALTPASVYRGRQALLEASDARGQLALGVYAHENGLYEEASRAFLYARQTARELDERADALWTRAREADAHSRFRRALQLEQGRQLDEALALFLEVYVTFPDVEDEQLQSDLVAHIHTLQHDLGLPTELPARQAPEGLDEEEIEALEEEEQAEEDEVARDEDGEIIFDDNLGRREEAPYNEARRLYQRLVQEIEQAEALVREARMEKGRRDITDRRISRALTEAYVKWQDVQSRLEGRMRGHLEGREWPRLRTLVDRLEPRLEELFEELATESLSMWVQRIDEEVRDARNQAYKWVNRILERAPEHEMARRVRLHLTEHALRERYR